MGGQGMTSTTAEQDTTAEQGTTVERGSAAEQGRHALDREFELAVTEQTIKLVEARTSDLAPAAYEVPVEVYIDPDHARREHLALFRRTPVLAALSCELPAPGDFKAVTLAGVPLLIMRDDAGTATAFLNACRHRGMKLTEG